MYSVTFWADYVRSLCPPCSERYIHCCESRHSKFVRGGMGTSRMFWSHSFKDRKKYYLALFVSILYKLTGSTIKLKGNQFGGSHTLPRVGNDAIWIICWEVKTKREEGADRWNSVGWEYRVKGDSKSGRRRFTARRSFLRTACPLWGSYAS